ncbi:MAG: hypothetical protein IPM56_19360 [Ignavibacteriales bacterium]|nr:MAG: hypothetical protein IPM56_19360 [Ignavibacteriales bacterium]
MKTFFLRVAIFLTISHSALLPQVEFFESQSFFYLSSKNYFFPDEEISINLWGTAKSTRNYTFSLAKIEQPDSFYINQFPQYYYSPFDYRLKLKPELINIVKSWKDEITFAGDENDSIAAEIKIGKIDRPGLYLVQVSTKTKSAYISFFVTKYGITIKAVGTKYLCFVSDLKTGEFVKNCNLDFFFKDKFIYRKNTGANAIILESFPDSLYQYLDYKEMFISGKVDKNYFVCRPILEYRNYKLSVPQIFSIKDKDHYEPGDSLHYSAIFRETKPEGVIIPSSNRVYKDGDYYEWDPELNMRQLNDYGILNQSFLVQKSAYSSSHHINWQTDNEQTIWDDNPFTIISDANPKESLNLFLDKKTYTKGEWIRAKVKYINPNPGTGIIPNKVRIGILRTQYNLPWWVDDEFSELLRVEYGKEYLAGYFNYSRDSIFGTLDKNGEFSFEYLPDSIYDDYIFEIYAQLLDRKQFSPGAVEKIIVARGTALAVLYPEKNIYRIGEQIKLNIKVKSLDQKKYSYNYKLTIKSLKDSADYWIEDKSVFSSEGVTDTNGKASIIFNPKDPECLRYAISVIVPDSEGNKITETIEVPLQSSVKPNPVGYPSIFTDREVYLPGDTMNLWIDFPGENYLLTFERGIILYQKKIVNAKVRQYFSMVLDTLFTPDFMINVYGTSGGKYFFEEKVIRVLSTHKFLKLDLNTDRNEYKQGDVVNTSVRVTDLEGRPINEADVTVVVKTKPNKDLVDYGKRSIYEIFYSGFAPWYYRTKINTGIDSTIVFKSSAKLKSYDDLYLGRKKDFKHNNKYKVYYKIINKDLDNQSNTGYHPRVKLNGNSGEIYIPLFLHSLLNGYEIESFKMVPEGYYHLYVWDWDIYNLMDKKERDIWDNLRSYYLNFLVGTYYIQSDTTITINYDHKSDWMLINTKENEEDRTIYRTSGDYKYAFRRDNIFDTWTGIFKDANPIGKQFTAYWKTNLRTDENGVVKFNFTIPAREVGSLGVVDINYSIPVQKQEWFIDAYAVTRESQVGEKRIPLKMEYPILIKNDHPTFMRGGDKSIIRTYIKNNTQTILNANINIKITGAVPLTCKIVQNSDSYEFNYKQEEYSTITIQPEQEMFLEWNILADKKSKVVNYIISMKNPVQFISSCDSIILINEEPLRELIYSDVTNENSYNNSYEIDLSGIPNDSDLKVNLMVMSSMPATVNLLRHRLNSSRLVNNIDFASRLLTDSSYKQLNAILNKYYPQSKWNFDSTILYNRYESGYALQNQNVCGWFNTLSDDPYTTAFIVYVNSQKNPKDYAHNVFNLVKRYNNLEEFYFKQKDNKKFDFAFLKFSLYQYYTSHKQDFSTVRYTFKDTNLLDLREEISRSLELKDIEIQGEGFKHILNNLVEWYHDSTSNISTYQIHLLMDTLLVSSENLSEINKTNPFKGSRMMLTYLLLKLRSLYRYDDNKTQKILYNFIKDVDKNYNNIPLYNSLLVSAIRNYLSYHSLEFPSYQVSFKANDEIIFKGTYSSASNFEYPVSVSIPYELIKSHFGDKLNIQITKQGEGYLHYNIVTTTNSITTEAKSVDGIQIEKKYTKIISEQQDADIAYRTETDFSELNIGDYILVETTIYLPQGDHSYLVVEESLPAGFSIVFDKEPVLNGLNLFSENSREVNHMEYTSDKLKLYYPSVSSKINVKYLLRAEAPGSVRFPGTKVYFEYKPFLQAYSDESMFIIKSK